MSCPSCPTTYKCMSCGHRYDAADGYQQAYTCPKCYGSMRPLA